MRIIWILSIQPTFINFLPGLILYYNIDDLTELLESRKGILVTLWWLLLIQKVNLATWVYKLYTQITLIISVYI